MSNTEIQSKVNELRELRRMADELTAEIESIQDAIKAHMTAIDADTLTGADYKITWKTVTSSRFDSTAFKKAMPELAERFTKSTTSRRFIVANDPTQALWIYILSAFVQNVNSSGLFL